jgi:hypothetical protein
VLDTLDALDLADEDKAAAKLAETYARALDEARSIEASANAILKRARSESEGDEDDLVEQVQALAAKLRARAALETLGPKLQAVLVELRATPRARAAGQPKGGAAPSPQGALASFRQGMGVARG